MLGHGERFTGGVELAVEQVDAGVAFDHVARDKVAHLFQLQLQLALVHAGVTRADAAHIQQPTGADPPAEARAVGPTIGRSRGARIANPAAEPALVRLCIDRRNGRAVNRGLARVERGAELRGHDAEIRSRGERLRRPGRRANG